jgi:hypothetical protein
MTDKKTCSLKNKFLCVGCMHNATQGIGTTLVYLVLCEAQEWLSVVHLHVLHALRSVYSVVSLLCVTGARLAQLPQG